jgi:hypothetical protein
MSWIETYQTVSHHVDAIVFHQPNPELRLRLTLRIIAAIVVVLLTLGPYGEFYTTTASYLHKRRPPFFTPELGRLFAVVRWAVVLLALANLLNIGGLVVSAAFALLFAIANHYTSCFVSRFWITNTHLNIFSVAITFALGLPLLVGNSNPDRNSGVDCFMSFTLFSIQIYASLIYFQAGLAKLMAGGLRWFTSGQSIYVATALHGTPVGRALLRWPKLFGFFGIFTGVFELCFPAFVWIPSWHVPFAITAIIFHLGTCIIMRISFWFLWLLYFPLFLQS